MSPEHVQQHMKTRLGAETLNTVLTAAKTLQYRHLLEQICKVQRFCAACQGLEVGQEADLARMVTFWATSVLARSSRGSGSM